MNEDPVLYAKSEGIATITLNRPAKANTLRMEMIDGLDCALADANRDREVKVVILEGAGDDFCGGFDFSGGLEHYEAIRELVAMKLVVNQAYDNMGLQSTQTLGPILDGIMRNTPEGREFVRVAASEGVKAAVTRRDGPFGDYSQAPPEEQPRKRSRLG